MNLSYYLVINAVIFCLGLFGILLHYNNILWFLIYTQLMVLAVSSNFIVYAKLWNDLNGQIFVWFALMLIAIQFAIGLAIALRSYKNEPALE